MFSYHAVYSVPGLAVGSFYHHFMAFPKAQEMIHLQTDAQNRNGLTKALLYHHIMAMNAI